MTNAKAADALGNFKLRPTVTQSYMRLDGLFTVWLPQDKRTWRIDDRYGQPVCGPKGAALRFMSRDAAIIVANAL